ncbi:zinc finger E-box-binding homeobox 1-like [Crassostrea angulata]|uniref:zinc finger E-box-binding homeobox 1-like n=1 Tax=Magallana angulata TaxID=2784310 RepID=UPI0022B15344|nr:zinc finger E-box-binding homeobox 1-like [Crassostrea angulata]
MSVRPSESLRKLVPEVDKKENARTGAIIELEIRRLKLKANARTGAIIELEIRRLKLKVIRIYFDTGKEQSEGKEKSQKATQLCAIPTQYSEDEFAVQRRPVVRSSSLQCPDCPKSSKRKNELKVRIKARHENVSFSCSKCQKTFAYKTNAIRHEAKCNGDDQNSSFQQKSTSEKREKSTERRGKEIKRKIFRMADY